MKRYVTHSSEEEEAGHAKVSQQRRARADQEAEGRKEDVDKSLCPASTGRNGEAGKQALDWLV